MDANDYESKLYSLFSSVAKGGALVGLAPPKKAPSSPNLKHETINQWSFCQFLECQAPRQTQRPPIENFVATVLIIFIRYCQVATNTEHIQT